jgi:hypothetical protein
MSLTIEFGALQEFIINKINDVPVKTKQQVIAVMNRDLIISENPEMKINLTESAWAKFLMKHTQEWKDPAGIGQIFYHTGQLFVQEG